MAKAEKHMLRASVFSAPTPPPSPPPPPLYPPIVNTMAANPAKLQRDMGQTPDRFHIHPAVPPFRRNQRSMKDAVKITIKDQQLCSVFCIVFVISQDVMPSGGAEASDEL